MDYSIEMLHIRKEFPGIVANDDITLQVKKGEIHAILGENGAGKSTLMSILFGLYKAEKGEIKINNKVVEINNPNDATAHKIGMVHQHFQLIENYTVTQNIILGKEGGFILSSRDASKKIKALSDKYNLNIDPNSVIEDITVGMQQRVEILKMLYVDADILIFDEPTAVLTPQEIDDLLEIMRGLQKEGKSIILITHKLNEIKQVADRCTIIRRGKFIDVVDVKDTSQEEMASLMVGRSVSFDVVKDVAKPAEPILEIKNLNVLNSKKLPSVRDFSLTVRAGEIVGIAGVDGNGQTELVEAISGLRKIESGNVIIASKDVTHLPIRDRNEAGLGHVPEDRQKRGLILEYNLKDNFVIKNYYYKPFSERGILRQSAMKDYGQNIIDTFDVRSGKGLYSFAKNLSGGNQQKAIVGREITNNPKLLIVVQPTRGLDVGAIEFIHEQIVAHRDAGNAVLVISFELDEIFNLSDRIAVISDGRLMDVVEVSEADERSIGLMMAGVSSKGDN